MRTKNLLIIILMISSIQIFAQNTPTGDESVYEPVKYLPIHKFPLSILHVYRYTDTTEVTKTFPDSTKTHYKRVVTDFFTLKRTKPDKDGFITLEVSLDSMRYYLKEGKAEIYWDSQDDASGGFNMQDLKYACVPLGHFFDMTLSPYDDIAKISGVNAEWYFNYLKTNLSKLSDTVEKFIWYDGFSNKRIAQIHKVKKILLPNEKIAIDSIWTSPFEIQIDNVNFADTVKPKITKVENGQIFVEAEINNLKALPGKYLFYGIKDMLLPIKSSKGVGKYRIEFSPRGAIEKAIGEFLVQLKIPVHKDIFKLDIKSTMYWTLLGMYRE